MSRIWRYALFTLTYPRLFLRRDRPVVENANKVAPGWARIYKEMVLVTDPAKPLPRVVKGTVMRVQALKMYEEEIENL